MAELTDVFGVDFAGREVDRYQVFSAVDGSRIGISFHHPDGSQTDVVLPQRSLDRLSQEIARAAALCRARLQECRH